MGNKKYKQKEIEMSQIYNIYCDESCHLENDQQSVMVLGSVWCEIDKAREINIRLREIKKQYVHSRQFEMKWTKVSPAQLQFYKDIIDYFFDDDDLHFRALIIPDKSKLDHKSFGQTHDDWYYKMYFDMLKVLLNPSHRYHIYLDIKDTKSAAKVRKLHDVLCNNIYDFSRQIIKKIQNVRSHEIEILQLTDLLIGAISYINRGLESSSAKLELINRIKERSGYSLTKTTLFLETKINLFRWRAQEGV